MAENGKPGAEPGRGGPMHPILEQIGQNRLIVIVRGLAPGSMRGLAEALHAGGIRMIEVTFDQAHPENWPGTCEAIKLLATDFAGRITPGAGTVLTEEQVEMAHDAGARYIISPNIDLDVIDKTRALGMASLPGAMTPTEIVQAYAEGADAVKIFPIGSLGPAYLKAVRAPLPHIPLMAVGGVNETNAAEYLAAGAMGLGVGGGMVNRAWIEAGEWDRITALAKAFVAAAQ
ncbi:bifunctional 4-hydroxy-2-oxoglutarate aldolase/2-dehydro-3-deoxy-phosphogluconate aldolase [Eubacteriales bacterium OttesenSCG-928-A19]|nr:bifunctional 4-hydroxy-2-oxoglutarate aldolase/2-dehydro-3-deoxy-phosphogluconate aldolase [Eubacteriales bacterium OttesenSCG-928-A19]